MWGAAAAECAGAAAPEAPRRANKRHGSDSTMRRAGASGEDLKSSWRRRPLEGMWTPAPPPFGGHVDAALRRATLRRVRAPPPLEGMWTPAPPPFEGHVDAALRRAPYGGSGLDFGYGRDRRKVLVKGASFELDVGVRR